MFFGIDPLYMMIMAPMMLLSLWATFRVKSSYNKYAKVAVQSGMTGAEVAAYILRQNRLSHVNVVRAQGVLSDHYDPTRKVVRLSEGVYHGRSIAAIGVAAHETGHAIQHATLYKPLILRNIIAPTASIGSNISWFIIFGGLLFGLLNLVKIGIALFSLVVIFQIITLPVEFNASSRAKKMIVSYGLVNRSELKGVSSVLNAAAMTYVAAAASAIATLFYFLLRVGLLGDD
jgi:hypothetical protein